MNWIMPNQSGKLAVCTTEALRSQRKDFLVCRRGADRLKPSVWNEFPWPKAREFMENRYLPILHEDISLSVLRVSNEHPTSRCEWVGEHGPRRKLYGGLGNNLLNLLNSLN